MPGTGFEPAWRISKKLAQVIQVKSLLPTTWNAFRSEDNQIERRLVDSKGPDPGMDRSSLCRVMYLTISRLYSIL